MGKEIERKFLIKESAPFSIGVNPLTFIKQGYIFIEKGKHLRIRLYKDKAILGLKYINGLVRDEFEYEIPFEDGLLMYAKCEFKLEKIRFSYKEEDYLFDIDMYPNGKTVVEVEFKSEEEANNWVKPQWIGDEVTGMSTYSNIEMAKLGLKF